MKIPYVLYELLVILPLCSIFMYWLFYSNPLLFSQTLPEFIAAVLGVFMGFALGHWSEFWRELGRAKKVLKSIKTELVYNVEMAEKTAEEVVGGTFERTPFKLFKIHTWNVFNRDLRVIQNVKLISDLGELYHELSSINEAMKVEPVNHTFYPQDKKSWKRISEKTQDLIKRIDNELKIFKK